MEKVFLPHGLIQYLDVQSPEEGYEDDRWAGASLL